MKLRTFIAGIAALVLTARVSAQAPVQGVVAEMTKAQTGDTGTITVTVAGKQVTYKVSEATTFQFNNQVSTWGANFLNVRVGKNVAVAPGPKNSATLVQILLPAPAPPPPPGPPRPPGPPPKPHRVHGVVVAFDPGSITIKLPNRTPPPPVEGMVTNVAVDEYKGHGFITVQAMGQKYPQTFMATARTRFTKMGVQVQDKQAVQVKWHETFLSIDRGERVKVFPRYGSPGLAGTVDILLKGAIAPPAIVLPDHFLQFQLQPTTSFEIVRAGQPAVTVSLKALSVGENVGILPPAVHSHLAADVHIVAPRAITGTLVHANAAGITVKTGGGKGKADLTQTVSHTGATHYAMVQGAKKHSIAMHALKAGEKVVIFQSAVPPHPAELVLTHPLPPKPHTTNGVLVSASSDTLIVKPDKGAVKTFTLNPATRLEAHDGKKTRTAAPADFVAGAKITVVALNTPPHLAHSVRIQVSNRRPPTSPVTNPNKKKKGRVSPGRVVGVRQSEPLLCYDHWVDEQHGHQWSSAIRFAPVTTSRR